MSRILVIDDDRPTRLQISKLLELEGYEVLAAEDGVKGVDAAIQELPDLIVCDIMMPELDGYGVLLKLRENPKTRLIPFIFLTAKSQLEDLRKGMELGADDYLTKPLSPPNLFNSISRRLEKRLHQEEEAQRQKEELSLQIAATLPNEVTHIIQRIVSLGNMIILKFSDQDTQAVAICDALRNETLSLKRHFRRIDLFGKLPKLYAHRFDDEILEYDSERASCEPAKAAAEAAALRLGRIDDLELDLCQGTIHLQKDYLEIIVDELVTNALESSAPGQKASLQISSEAGMLSIRVSDTGRGLTDTRIEELQSFSKFGQLSQSSDRICLGIPLVHGITRLHGGEFSLEQNQSGGITACVYLPDESQL